MFSSLLLLRRRLVKGFGCGQRQRGRPDKETTKHQRNLCGNYFGSKRRERDKRGHTKYLLPEVNLSKGQNSAGVRRSTRKGHEREQKYVESKSVLKNTTTSTRAWFFITADDGSKICFERAGLARRTLVNPSLEEVRGLEQRASTVVVVVVVVVEAARRKSLTPRSFLR